MRLHSKRLCEEIGARKGVWNVAPQLGACSSSWILFQVDARLGCIDLVNTFVPVSGQSFKTLPLAVLIGTLCCRREATATSSIYNTRRAILGLLDDKVHPSRYG
jgi:hypothetical protein